MTSDSTKILNEVGKLDKKGGVSSTDKEAIENLSKFTEEQIIGSLEVFELDSVLATLTYERNASSDLKIKDIYQKLINKFSNAKQKKLSGISTGTSVDINTQKKFTNKSGLLSIYPSISFGSGTMYDIKVVSENSDKISIKLENWLVNGITITDIPADSTKIMNLINQLKYDNGLSSGSNRNRFQTYFQYMGISNPVGTPSVETQPTASKSNKENTPNSADVKRKKAIEYSKKFLKEKDIEVEDLQKALNKAGVRLNGKEIDEDDILGTETYKAVIKYQSDNGLTADGYVGPLTLAKLGLTSASTESPTPSKAPASGGSADSSGLPKALGTPRTPPAGSGTSPVPNPEPKMKATIEISQTNIDALAEELNKPTLDLSKIESLIKGKDINKEYTYKGRPYVISLDVIARGYKSVLELLFKHGLDINNKDSEGYSILMCSAYRGEKEILELLLNKGADKEHKDKYGYTALYYSVKYNKLETLHLLLNKGVNINVLNNNGNTVLMHAVMTKNKEIVKILIDKGADKTLKNKEGKIALDYAKHNNDTEIIKLLDPLTVPSTPEISQSDIDIIYQELLKPAPNRTLIESLIKGKNLNKPYNFNGSIDYITVFAVVSKHKEILELLLNNGADVNIKSSVSSLSLLMYASQIGNKEIVDLLIKKRIDINYQNNNMTALDYAININNKEIVELLLNSGANPNIVDSNGTTSFLYSVELGNKEVIELLINKGANIQVKNKDGYTAIDYAIDMGNKDLLIYLLNKGVNPNTVNNEGTSPLIISTDMENPEFVELLLNKGANINFKSTDGFTSLMYSVLRGNKELVKLFIDKGASKILKSNEGKTVLEYAITNGDIEIIKLIDPSWTSPSTPAAPSTVSPAPSGAPTMSTNTEISQTDINTIFKELDKSSPSFTIIESLIKGKDINKEYKYTTDNFKIIFYAVEKGHKEIVELLLNNGADINTIESDGYTILMHAANKEYKDIVELLLNMGANKDLKSKDGKTALDYAKMNNNQEIIDLIDPTASLEILPADIQKLFAELDKTTPDTTTIKGLIDKKDLNKELEYKSNNHNLLIYATNNGHKNIVNLLLENGLKIDSVDKDGFTALMYSVLRGNKELVKLFIDKGASKILKSNEGKTVLEYAITNGDIEIIKLIDPSWTSPSTPAALSTLPPVPSGAPAAPSAGSSPAPVTPNGLPTNPNSGSNVVPPYDPSNAI